MTVKNLQVAVVGGGISGLAAAKALIHRGFHVNVYEQSSMLKEVGAGVFIYPNSLRQLERMGLGDAMSRVGARVGAGSEYCRMDGTVVGKILTTDSDGWNGMYGMHRADLLQVLVNALPSNIIHTGHKCIEFKQDKDGAILQFENGNEVRADLVIAADGINSVLQKYVVEPSAPEYAGFRAYRGVIPFDKVPGWRSESHLVWMGDGKHFMVFPVRSGTLVNYVGFVPTKDETIESWSATGDRDELAATGRTTVLVAVVLSAQATDAGVNKATPALFATADTPEKMAALGVTPTGIEKLPFASGTSTSFPPERT